jgi:AcrR family transcriptional regulator
MDRQSSIVRSAQPLFAQFGLKNVTADDIAKEARISKATIYRHFKNKTEIFDAVIQDEVDSLLASIREAVDAEDTAVEKLRAHLNIRLGKVSEFVNFYRVTQESSSDYWPHIAQVRTDFLQKEQQAVAEILSLGVRTGELLVEDPEKTAYIMSLALASVEYQWFLDENLFTLPELVDTMLQMIVFGIGRQSQ